MGENADRRSIYSRIAPLYDLADGAFEYLRYRHIRPRVFEAVSEADRLLDCGVGTGRNIPYYPEGVEATGFDVSPEMLDRAERRAESLGRDVDLVEADITDLPFEADAFDAAVGTFLFCVLPPKLHGRALDELHRVLRPDGRLVLVDYYLPESGLRRLVMRLWAPIVRRLYGASFRHGTYEHVRESTFEIEAFGPVHSEVVRMLEARADDG